MSTVTEPHEIKDKNRPSRALKRALISKEVEEGHLTIPQSFAEAADVINMLDEGKSGRDIRKKYPHIRFSDITACRAYRVKFLAHTLADVFGVSRQKPQMMIDENIAYKLLYKIVPLLGKSSHVYAEGLYDENNLDYKHIWKHMIGKRYSGILTTDTDFKVIARDYREHLESTYGALQNAPEKVLPPVVIIAPRAFSNKNLAALIEKHRGEISALLQNRGHVAWAELGEEGLVMSQYCCTPNLRTSDQKPVHG